jgi:hypothetical protein
VGIWTLALFSANPKKTLGANEWKIRGSAISP